MTLAQGTEQHLQDWYGFYKSINTSNNNNKWLIDVALDYYENKMMEYDTNKHNEDNQLTNVETASTIISSFYFKTNNNTHHNSI
jgi:hypothetical protein